MRRRRRVRRQRADRCGPEARRKIRRRDRAPARWRRRHAARSASTQTLFGLSGVKAPRVLLVGLGDQKKFDAARFHRANTEAARVLKGLPLKNAVSYLTEIDVAGKDDAWKMRTAAVATDTAAYKYTATFKPREKSKTPEFESIAFAGADSAKSVARRRQRDRQRRALRARTRQPAAEHLQSAIHRRPGQEARRRTRKRDLRSSRRSRHAQARHGRAARRFAGFGERTEVRDPAVQRRGRERQTGRAGRQRHHLRHRRHLDQAQFRHGRNEVRHVRRSRRARRVPFRRRD